MSMDWIRLNYGVPAKRGQVVRFRGERGVIVGSRAQYLRIRLRGSEDIITAHPTWELEYLSEEPA